MSSSMATLATLVALMITPLLTSAEVQSPEKMPEARCDLTTQAKYPMMESPKYEDAVKSIEGFCRQFPIPETSDLKVYTKDSYFEIYAWPEPERYLDVSEKTCNDLLKTALENCGRTEGAPEGKGADDKRVGGVLFLKEGEGELDGYYFGWWPYQAKKKEGK